MVSKHGGEITKGNKTARVPKTTTELAFRD